MKRRKYRLLTAALIVGLPLLAMGIAKLVHEPVRTNTPQVAGASTTTLQVLPATGKPTPLDFLLQGSEPIPAAVPQDELQPQSNQLQPNAKADSVKQWLQGSKPPGE